MSTHESDQPFGIVEERGIATQGYRITTHGEEVTGRQADVVWRYLDEKDINPVDFMNANGKFDQGEANGIAADLNGIYHGYRQTCLPLHYEIPQKKLKG